MAVRLNCGITLNSQNTNANTSTVTAWVDAITTQGSYNLTGGAHGTVTFGGNASGSYNFNAMFNKLSTTRIYTRQFTVNHNANGTASVNFNVSFVTQVSSGTVYGSASLTLPTIPRASRPSVTGNLTLGQAMTINTNRASGSFTHTLKYRYGNGAYTGTIASNVGASYSYTPPLSFANNVKTATSFRFAVICDTYNGGTLIGTNETVVTLNIPSSVAPSVSALSCSDAAGYYSQFGSRYIQGKSSVRATATAAGSYGSTITRYRFELVALNGNDAQQVEGTSNAQTIGTPVASGTRTVRVTVTDSRGRTATRTTTITVSAYAAPSITVFTADRWDTTDNEVNDESTTIRASATVSGTQTIGTVANSFTVSFYSRKNIANPGNWTTKGSYTNTGSSFTRSVNLTSYDQTSAWAIRVVVTDRLGSSVEQIMTVGAATPVMDFRYDGKVIGVFNTAQSFESTSAGGGFEDEEEFTGFHSGDNIYLRRGSALVGTTEREDGTGERWQKMVEPFYTQLVNSLADPWTESTFRSFSHVLRNGFFLAFGNPGDSTAQCFARQNSSGHTQMYWTDGGIRGNMYTRLWSGRAEIGSTFTVEDIEKYNLFSVMTTNNRACICGRRTAEDTYIGGCSAMGSVQNTSGVYVQFVALRINGNQVTVTAAHQAQWTGSVWSPQDGNPPTAIGNIVGIL